MSFDGLDDYSGFHKNVANELAKSIKSGDHETAITELNSLLDLFNQDIQSAQETGEHPLLIISKIFDTKFLYIVLGVQLVIMLIVTLFREFYARRKILKLLNYEKLKASYAMKIDE